MRTNLLILLMSLLGSVLLAEGVLRYVYAPAPLTFRMKLQRAQGPDQGTDAMLSFDQENLRFTPGLKTTITHSEYVTHVSIDAYGYRNPCVGGLPARILLIGDSFVFGIGVDDAGTLQCLLNDSVSTYAMGIPGAGPTEYRRMIEKQFRSLVGHGLVAKDAGVVVVLFSGNDFEGLLDEPQTGAERTLPAHGGTGDALLGRFFQRVNELVFRAWPTKDSFLLNLTKMAIVRRSFRISESPDFLRLNTGSTLYRAQAANERHSEFIERSASHFRRMGELRRALGISEMSYLIVPDVNEIDLERAASTLSLYGELPSNFALGFKDEVLVEAARRSGTKIVDAYGCFGKSGASAFYYFLDNHLNAQGTRRLVECVREGLAP